MKVLMRWAVENRAAMNLILIVTFLVGIVSIGLMRREVFPNFELDIVVVEVPYPGASPEELEEGVCLKIEEAVRSVDGIKRVTSIAREGLGFVVLELNAHVAAQKVLAEVRSEVDRIPSFPELAEDPEVRQITFREPAIRVGILADDGELLDADLRLRELAESVRNDLLQLKSVSQTVIVGERPYQIDVEISEDTLRKYGLSLQNVADVLRRENIELPGGKIQGSREAVLLRGKNKYLRGEDIAQLPIITRPDGTVLTVADLGTVHDGFDDGTSYSRVNGRDAIVLSVDRTSSEDLIKIVDEVKNYVANKKLPAGYSLTVWNDTSIDVRDRIELLTEDGLQGLVLVFIVLAIFLEFRLAFWVAMGIPFAILATCGVLYATGGTLNMLTLFSFLMALGILVDDAIVVSENFHSHLSEGRSPMRAAIDAAAEVAPSVTAGVFCTVIAFVPLFFVSGVMGKFIACMPLTVVAMLLISLVEGFTILPCHLGHEGMLREIIGMTRGIRRTILSSGLIQILAGGWILLVVASIAELIVAAIDYLARGLKRFFDQVNRYADMLVHTLVHRTYLPTLRFFLRHIPLAYALQIAFLLVTLTCYAAGWTRYTTFPDMDARVVQAKITFPDGTPAHVTDAAVKQAADAIRRIHAKLEAEGKPLIEIVHETIGQRSGLGTFGPEPRDTGEFVGGVYVELVGAEGRDLTSEQIATLWRQETGPIAGVETAVFEVQQIGPGGKDIEFKLLASNEHWTDLERAIEETKASLIEFGGVFDVTDDSYLGKWEYQIRMNDRGHSMGVTTADLAETVRAAFYGEEVMRLQRGRHEVKLMVRYPREDRNSVATLQNIRVRGQDGSERPIAELAAFDVRRGYSEIQRVDQQRAITISANVEETTNAGEVLETLQAGPLKKILETYPGVSVRWEGQKEQDAESVQSLGLGAVVALGAMFILLTFQLQSVIQPLLIIYLIPFAAAGAIWGHIVMGLDVTLFSIFGLVALMGMVVNDSIVLLDFINAQRREFPTESTAYSILEASRRRIRPVALNTVTSVIGLIPLLADQSFQAQALIPMGVSLVFGLATSTVLGLLILPVSYYMVSRAIPLTQVLHEPDEGPKASEAVSSYSTKSLVD
jgi:hydrophobic/amphiphilic exporter-1 (mainly G- bacteria), HAE1 family